LNPIFNLTPKTLKYKPETQNPKLKVVQRNSCWNQNAQAQLQVNVRSILLKFSALQLVSTLKSHPRLLVQNAVSSHALFFLTELPGELPVILKRRKPKEALHKLET